MLTLNDISWNDMTDTLSTLNYDVALYLRLNDYKIPGTNHVDLLTSDTYIVVSETHPLASMKELTFEDIRYESFSVDILPRHNTVNYFSLYELFEKHGANQPNIMPARNMEICLLNIRSGVAIGIACPLFLPASSENLRYIPFKELNPATLSLYWNKKNHNELIPIFIEYITQSIKLYL